LTTKLLVDPTGKKMGKSEGNMIMLTDSAEEMFGKIMNWPDTLLPLGFELCTDLDFERNKNPRDEKLRLAYEVVKIYCGEKEAEKAKENFVKLFSKKEIPDNLEEIKAKDGEELGEVLVKNKIVSSNSEFRRLIKADAIDVNNKTIHDSDFMIQENIVVKVGKKKFLKIII
jgi:tyrosyl-tRNA synthetase